MGTFLTLLDNPDDPTGLSRAPPTRETTPAEQEVLVGSSRDPVAADVEAGRATRADELRSRAGTMTDDEIAREARREMRRQQEERRKAIRAIGGV